MSSLAVILTLGSMVSVNIVKGQVLSDSSKFVQNVNEPDIYVYGIVKEYNKNLALNNCIIEIFSEGKLIETQTTMESGRFVFFLPLDKEYKIMFDLEGYLPKHVIVDVKNIPESIEKQRGFSFQEVSMSLYKDDDINGNLRDFNYPIGKAKYNPTTETVEWDFEYTENLRKKLEDKVNQDAKTKIENKNR